MPPDSLQITERIVFDGTLSTATAIGLGLLLSAIAAWLLWRERQAIGPRWAGLFWLLRMTAIGCALWMLSGPVRETVEQTTVTQSIAILADASLSMDTVDTPAATDLLRWTLASATDSQMSLLGHCDSLKVALRVASQAGEKSSQLLREHRPVKTMKQAVDEVRVATRRAEQHCRQLILRLKNDDALADRVGRVETLLLGPISTALKDLQESLEGGNRPLVGELSESLEMLNDSLAGVTRRVETLTRDLADSLTENRSPSSYDGHELTRREKSLQVLDVLQKNVLGDLAKKIRIRKFQFDSQLTPIAAELSWSKAADLLASVASEQDFAAKSQPPLTDLTAVLKQLSTDRTAQSTRLAIVITDGNHTALSDQTPLEIATQISDLPVFSVPIGSSTLVRDLRLHRVEAPATVVEKDTGLIDAIVTAIDCDGRSTVVTLRHEGQEIDRQTVVFAGDRVDHRIQFSVPARKIGWQDYELTVEPLVDEESVANNVAPISWEVVRDKFRVLLADGVSHWEFRYLQQLFRRDPHTECDELLFYPRLRGTGEMATNPRLPERVDDWAVYDVVILGDLGVQQFGTASQESLAEYVRERHGHLILFAGRDHMPREYRGKPLMDLLPVTATSLNTLNGGNSEEGYTLMLTDEGRLHSALAIEDSHQASEAAWLSVYRKKPIFKLSEYCRPKPTARTLLRAVPTQRAVVVDDRATLKELPAFLCWHQVGGGRVVYMAAAETWKLRFRAHDRRHHRFWGQLIRWITAENLGSGTELVRLSTNKNRYNRKEPIEVTVWLKDQTGRPLTGQTLQIRVQTLDDEVASAELVSDPEVSGRYFCSLESLPPGTYELVIQGSVVDELFSSVEDKSPIRSMILVEAGDQLELLDTRCNRTVLEQIAEITGGQVVPPTAIAEVLQLASLSPEVNETVRRTPLWNRWSNLWIVLGCLVFEWIVRKQKGLV